MANKDRGKGILNTGNYYLGGTLPANAVSIGIWPEGKNGVVPSNFREASDKLKGLAAQQVQAQVQKGVRPVYEIGTTAYYLVDGRPQGQGQIAYMFGPSGEVVAKLKDFSDLCAPCTLRVSHSGNDKCEENDPGHNGNECVDFKSGTLTSFSLQATAQDFMVTGNIGFIFMDVQSA